MSVNHSPKSNSRRILELPLRLALKVTMNHVSQRHVDKYLKLVEHFYDHKGPQKAIELLKDYQLYVRQVTLGITPESIAWHRVDRTNFPRVLNP
jgi:hypothetical protein